MKNWRMVIDRLKGRGVQQEKDLDRELRAHLDLEAVIQEGLKKCTAAAPVSGSYGDR